ncbi:MAG TPA: beta-N-acetylhexosaminidase, partial [Mucilaginibacter sp.]
MRAVLFSFLLFACISVNAQQPATLNLMPVPAKLQLKDGTFRITNQFTISVKSDASDSILYRAVNRAYQVLNRKTGVVFGIQYITLNDTLKNPSMQLSVDTKAGFKPGIDESYTLNIDQDHVALTAPNSVGALRGLQTLIQLCTSDSQGYYFPCVSISDMPRFQWRGLMIDVARHFISVDEMERNINAMAAVKMNVLHWHLSDDEGFRVESKIFPLLQEKGSNGDYYTQAQLKEVVRYAQDRGIMVVPEFDMPGHSQSWFAGYPELASQPGPYRPGLRAQWMNEHPDPNRPKSGGMASMITDLEAATFDPTNEKVYKFLNKFLGEMATIFPAGYVHVGADENNGLAWKLNPKIVEWMTKHKIQTTDDLQLYFVGRVHDILKKHNRQLIGWEEIYSDKLPKDAIVHKWIPASISKFVKSHGEPEEFASHGYETLISEGFYLDVFMPASFHYTNPAFMIETSPKILGGEGAQWSEIADNENISLRMWPRAGAIAERLWSPLSVNDVPDMYRRLFILSDEFDQQ